MSPDALPRVTCVVCAYDYERYVAQALDSALAQDYPADRLEIVVVDDGSTDATPQILAGYGDRIRVVRQENAGLNAATERGIREATGELVALLDADDLWLPHKLRLQVELLARRPEVGLVYSDMELMDGEGTTYARSYFATYGLVPARGPGALAALIRANTVPAPSIVFRRELAGHVLPVAPEASFQDWWLGVRVAEVAEIDLVPAALVRYRVHGSNMVASSGGDKLLRNLRSDVVFRRWMLRDLDLDGLDAHELHAIWKGFVDAVAWLAERASTTLADELEVAPAARARAAALGARARKLASGDPRAAMRALLAARADDPFDRDLKALMQEVVRAAPRTASAAPALVAGAAGAGGPAPAAAAPPAERLTWAEERYGDGDVDAAIEALVAVAADAAGSGEDGIAAQAHADLAVIAWELGDPGAARAAARSALGHDPRSVAALEILAHVAGRAGDRLREVHWLARATEADPADPALWRDLAAARASVARWAGAGRAYDAAAALEPLPVEHVEQRERVLRALAAEPVEDGAELPPPGRVLVCVDLFHPSVGGTERLAEHVGTSLRELGWDVAVACRAHPDRVPGPRLGMDVHEIHRRPREELRRIVARGRFDAVLALGDPYAWPVPATLRLPACGPRTVVVPCMNAENTRALRRDPDRLREWRELLGRAGAVVRSSEAGFDAHLLADLGVPGAYVPNAVERLEPEGSLHTLLGLDPGRPTLLCVSNLYPSKNQAGLLEALADRPGSWQLVLVGHPAPDFPEEAERVERLVAADPRVRLVRGMPPELVAAALTEADLFVLPSLSDATPLVILEAMSHGLPWLATQHCGAVHDWAGGLVVDPGDLGDAIDHLLADPAARERLGAAGHEHWEACFTRATVARRYDALLRGAQDLTALPGPAGAAAATEAVRAAFYDASVAPAVLTHGAG